MTQINLTDIPERETNISALIREFSLKGMDKSYIDTALIKMHNEGQIVLRSRKVCGRTLSEMANIAVVANNRIFTTVQRAC
jgi:L-lactate utilization protein LutC